MKNGLIRATLALAAFSGSLMGNLAQAQDLSGARTFEVVFENRTKHHIEVEKVWQQCVSTSHTDKTCKVESGETCTLRVVPEAKCLGGGGFGGKRTEIRYRAYIDSDNNENYRKLCSETRSHEGCQAITVKARNPEHNQGVATTDVSRDNRFYRAHITYREQQKQAIVTITHRD